MSAVTEQRDAQYTNCWFTKLVEGGRQKMGHVPPHTSRSNHGVVISTTLMMSPGRCWWMSLRERNSS